VSPSILTSSRVSGWYWGGQSIDDYYNENHLPRNRKPKPSQGKVRFRLGKGWMAPFIHEAVRGMSERESKTVTVAPDQAYGPCE
jgi:FKBP-type peptidyl-prolyl cis-trans isomerase 2